MASASPFHRGRPRRRPELTLPIPQRDPSLAVPLPLPPNSYVPSLPVSGGTGRGGDYQNCNHMDFSDLHRVDRIGSGSGGSVYKVLHRPSQTVYALKVIHGDHEDSIRRQIVREIEILRGVDNPNVVKCYDMSVTNGEIQVLLEYMDAGSLEGRRIVEEHALANITRQILSGLCYLHSRKIVHRDIKPSNLLVNRKNEVKIADFGVSRILKQTMDPCNSSVGTVAYMSPERINTDINHGMYDGYAGDIWSLGVSILEFYLGRFPFDMGRQSDFASFLCAICMSKPPEPPPSASRNFRDFIRCCLQREPSMRHSARSLMDHPFILQNQVSHPLLPPASSRPPSW